MEYVVPQIGYITQILQPPINYIIIAIIIGAMVAKQVMNSRKSVTFADKIEPSDITSEKIDETSTKEQTDNDSVGSNIRIDESFSTDDKVLDEKKSIDEEKE